MESRRVGNQRHDVTRAGAAAWVEARDQALPEVHQQV
jgi:hypothetical protein